MTMNIDTNPLKSTTYDIAIIGAGVVGLACAIALAQRHYQVLLVDNRTEPTDEQFARLLAHRDARVYALNLSSIALLKEIDAWQFVTRKADYHRMQVWAKDGKGELNFCQDEFLPSMLGAMVEPSVLDFALYQRAKQADLSAYLTIAYQATLGQIDEQAEQIHLTIRQNGQSKQIRTRLLIGADGRKSQVRAELGIGLATLDYGQTAVCCAVLTDLPHANVARQIMLPTGTLAMLPIADLCEQDGGRWQSIVWTLPTDLAQAMLSLDDKKLAGELAQAMNYELGDVLQVESLASFALSAQTADRYAVNRAALIGDAAHGVHPLAGQGLNLGLDDVICLLEQLDGVAKRNAPLHQKALWDYQRHIKAHHELMMHGFSAINAAFASGFAKQKTVQWLRAESVDWLSKQKPIMQFLINRANAR